MKLITTVPTRHHGRPRPDLPRPTVVPHVRIDLIASDHDIPDLVHIITKVAPLRECPNSIWITPVEALTRIRTGERGTEALCGQAPIASSNAT